MPSRKRNKGKERKAKKAEQEERIMRNRWKTWALGDGQVTQCNHGVDLTIPDEVNHPVAKFIDALLIFGDHNITMHVGQYFLDTFTTHQEVWDNERYREMVVNIFVVIGTNCILSRERVDSFLAHAIVTLENYDGEGIVSTLNSRVVAAKMRDLRHRGRSTMRDALKFYRKRATCKCLKDMHLKARKTFPKEGKCFHCREVKERSLLMVCSRCGIMQYCSRKCQVAHWSRHKSDCDIWCSPA